ncbi:class I SAM-dependent methyltransferase [Microvirga aerilata]|uniref:class I SAM-dependent methyltransferase n=1 Tax=Microvirga aerilata TaxID=670292 RepID=UPI00363C7BFF
MRDYDMTDWSAGYVVDVDYTHGFYQELTPSLLSFFALLQGVQAPDPGASSLAYCELGCGQGFSTNLLASANPHIEFHATDFNPAHIAGARDLARSAGIENAHFYDDSFAEFLTRNDLPAFDFITLHGIYSWISPENRQAIVGFIRKKLKPGGLVYLSYNAMPGWASMMPLRRLLVEHAAAQGSAQSLQARIAASLGFADKLGSLDARYFANHPKLAGRVEKLKGQNPNYVAHEYFNRDLTPFYFMDVAQELAEAKLTWVGPANALDTLDEINLTQEQRSSSPASTTLPCARPRATTSSTSSSGATSSSRVPCGFRPTSSAKNGSRRALPCPAPAPGSRASCAACAIRSGCRVRCTIR